MDGSGWGPSSRGGFNMQAFSLEDELSQAAESLRIATSHKHCE